MASAPAQTHACKPVPSAYARAPALQGATPGRFYRPELDMLRFFAFLFVFLCHSIDINPRSGLLSHSPALARLLIFLKFTGGYGLSLFFLLSAFLITTLLVLERDRTGTIHIKSFYLRRILRIWPLYFTYLGVAFALGMLWAPAHFSGRALVAFFALSANWYALAAGPVTLAAQFLWSISVEEQFYLLWPSAVWFLTDKGIRDLCMALSVVSLASIGVLAANGSTVLHLWFNSLSQVLFFAAGGLLALGLKPGQQTPCWMRLTGGAAACLVCWLLAGICSSLGHPDELVTAARAIGCYALIAIGAASLLWAFLHMPRSLLSAPLVYLGRISYGLYVFHGMALLAGRTFMGPHLHSGLWMLPTLLLTIALASISYEGLEKPFLKLKHRFEFVPSRTA